MSINEALQAAAEGNFIRVQSLLEVANLLPERMTIQIKDTVEFHFDDGMPWTEVHRDYWFKHDNHILFDWWEKYYGQYGGGYTGWWVEEADANGPPDGMKEFIRYFNIEFPDIDVPKPTYEGDDE